MEVPVLRNISIKERFPLPPLGIIAKEADKIYLPPIETKHSTYWIAGITLLVIFAGIGIYYFVIKPPVYQFIKEEERNNLKRQTTT